MLRALGITAGFALLCWPLWDRSIVFRDSFLYYAPYKHLVAGALRGGEIFGWNPWQFLGMPFVADVQAGWFYPLNLFYVALPFEQAHRLYILAHYPLAAFGVDLFLRRRGVSGEAALFAGVGYALSGYMVSQNANVPFLAAPALAPYAFYFLERAFGQGARQALGAGVVIALQVFAGEPQGAALTALAAVAFALSGAGGAATRVAALRAVAVALGASLVLSLVQVLPALEMLGLSVRRAGLPLEEASALSFHPGRLVEFVFPTPFGTICPDYSYWGAFAVGPSPSGINVPWSPTVYVGFPLLALAGLGAAAAVRRGRPWALLSGTAAALALALGRHLPLFEQLHGFVPFFRFFRYPEKYLAWFTLGLAVLAALGFEQVRRLARENPRALVTWAVRYLVAALGLSVLWAAAGARLSAAAGGLVAGSAAESAALEHLAGGMRHFLLVNLGAGLLLLVAAAGQRRARLAAGLAPALLAADLAAANLTTVCTAPAGLLERPSAAAVCIWPEGRPPLGGFRVVRENLEYRTPGAGGTAGLVERMSLWDRQTLRPNLGSMEGFENLAGYHESAPVEGLELLDHPRSDIAALYNAGFAISGLDRPPLRRTRSEQVCRDPRWDLSVLRLSDARPRAYWVGRAIAAADTREAAQLLRDEDLTGAVVLTGSGFPPDDPAASGRPLAPAVPLRYEPDLVELAVDAPAAGWLVLSDRHYPGWRAWVDSRPAAIEKANVMVRAVRVPAGASRVLFRFEPVLWRIGASISGLGWVVALGVWALGRRGGAPHGARELARSANHSAGPEP